MYVFSEKLNGPNFQWWKWVHHCFGPPWPSTQTEARIHPINTEGTRSAGSGKRGEGKTTIIFVLFCLNCYYFWENLTKKERRYHGILVFVFLTVAEEPIIYLDDRCCCGGSDFCIIKHEYQHKYECIKDDVVIEKTYSGYESNTINDSSIDSIVI